MKSVLLLFFAITTAAFCQAQGTPPDYFNEIGIYGGIAPFTHPSKVVDKGDKNVLPYIVSLNYNYNFTEDLQAGLDVSMTQWKATGDQLYHNLFSQPLGSQTTTYLYADRSWSVTARFNKMIPFYDNYRLNRANFYFGVSAGVQFTLNDGSMGYSQYNGLSGEQYRYVSSYNYGSGAGYTFGLQTGINYYVTAHWGFNAEFAPRFAHISGIDTRYGSRNGQYDIAYFPVQLGLRFRFGSGGHYL